MRGIVHPKFTIKDFLELFEFAGYTTYLFCLCQIIQSHNPVSVRLPCHEEVHLQTFIKCFRLTRLKNFLKAQISVFLARKIDDLNLALSTVLYEKLNTIVYVLMQTVVSNTGCHWQKKASSCPHNLTSPPPLLMLAQVQLQH